LAESAQVRAAGGVLWRYVDGVVRVALVHRPKYDDWSLPKGKLDPGEAAVVGGVREVAEETGFAAVAGRTLGVSRYRVPHHGRDVEKSVRWWAMRATGGEFAPSAEVDALRWLPVSSALSKVTGGYDCAPLKAFAAEPPETTTVLLVRHGSAGSREAWKGEDDLRPLDSRGVEQAAALTDVLAAYGVTRVLSAPPLRCVQTVLPVASRLGLPVEPAPAAAEKASGTAGLTCLLRELAERGQPAVVCSQGGVIPSAVTALAAPLGVTSAATPKGGRWALTFCDSRLVDADSTAGSMD
jgi:8-oxo-dGTP pyrophosphatase MutT (NUDIX family)/phosphohistidine phosphatase SixA